VIGLAVAMLTLVALIATAIVRNFIAKKRSGKEDAAPSIPGPMQAEESLAPTYVAEETVDMQAPGGGLSPEKDLQTVEII
jgi:hypothetical protein